MDRMNACPLHQRLCMQPDRRVKCHLDDWHIQYAAFPCQGGILYFKISKGHAALVWTSPKTLSVPRRAGACRTKIPVNSGGGAPLVKGTNTVKACAILHGSRGTMQQV